VTLVAGQPATRFITRFNRNPLKTADLTVPLLVLRPNATSVSTGAKPPTGYPVVIFQHGITRNRADALAVADAFADAGFVVVAMDLALHGITPTSPTAFLRVPGTTEQTFDVDYVNNTTLAPGADGQVDGSGSSFVNLSNTLVTRDNLRQSVVGLMALTRALPNLDLDGDTVGDIDPARISFVGHSLGGIVGTVYTANSTALRSSSILMAGGGVAQTIVDSPAFGPVIIAGLQRQSALFQPGTTFFNTFIRDAQTAADAGDPLNYVAAALAAKPMHFTQVVGGSGAGQVADQVVPNSSTARLFAAAGAGLTRTTAAGFAAPDTFVNFTAGDHGTILDPTRSLAATIEMQRQVVTFAAFGGTQYLVQDTSVIQP
jgi:pimeloyl-ACP methyl ester carboxylesterase